MFKTEATILAVTKTTVKDKKKSFVLAEYGDKYKNQIYIEFFDKRAEELPQLEQGNEVEISFSVRTNEWQGKYYTNLSGWSVKLLSEPVQGETKQPDTICGDFPERSEYGKNINDFPEPNDLPF
jgi:hypothetical protein